MTQALRAVSAAAAFAAAAGLVGCASSQAASSVTAAPAASLFTRVPGEIGAFTLTERASVTGMPGDSLFRFSDGSRTRLTVFVYDVEADVKIEPDSQKWTAHEGEKFKTALDIRRQRGQIAAYVIAFSDTSRRAVDGRNLLEHSIATPIRSRNGAIAVDLQYLYLIDGKFVKVRATIPEQGWQQTTVPSFARELARRMAGGT